MAETMTAQGLVLAWWWALILLPLPWLVRRWLRPAPDAGMQALRVPWFGLMRDAAATWLKKPLLAAIATLAWVLLVVAAARPQWVGEIVTLPVTGRDLLLAVDISGSMDTQDMFLAGEAVNRLEKGRRRVHPAPPR
jgi:Ca-activated chloride channel family protein